MFYSASTNGFYDEDFPAEKPSDVIEISQEQYNSLLDGQSKGKQIKGDENGSPVLADYPKRDNREINLEKQQILMNEAKNKMFLPQTKLLLGQASASEKLLLTNWVNYTDALQKLDLDDPTWPEAPES